MAALARVIDSDHAETSAEAAEVDRVMSLLRSHEITQQRAARMLGMSLSELLRFASARGVSVIDYEMDDFERELASIREHGI